MSEDSSAKIGVCDLLFAWAIGVSDKSAEGFAAVVALVSAFLIIVGFRARKSPERLASAQSVWDRTWLCARCGHRWQE